MLATAQVNHNASMLLSPPDIEAYDAVYQRLIAKLEFSNLSSSIAMEEMKYTTAVPTIYVA